MMLNELWNPIWRILRPIVEGVLWIGHRLVSGVSTTWGFTVFGVLAGFMCVWWWFGVARPAKAVAFSTSHPVLYKVTGVATLVLQPPMWLLCFFVWWGTAMKLANKGPSQGFLGDLVELSFLIIPAIFLFLWWFAAKLQSRRQTDIDKPPSSWGFFTALSTTSLLCVLFVILAAITA